MGGALLLLSNCFHLLSEAVILSRQSARTPDLRDFLNFIVCVFHSCISAFLWLICKTDRKQQKAKRCVPAHISLLYSDFFVFIKYKIQVKKNTITVIEAETFLWLASHINRGLQQYVGVASDLTARLRWPSGIHLLSLSSLLLPLKL